MTLNRLVKFAMVVAFLSTLVLTGCLKTRAEMGEVEAQRTQQTQISTIQQSKADQESKLYALQDEMRNMMGRLEALERKEHENVQKGPTNQELIEQMKIFEQTITSLRTKIEELDAQIKNPPKLGGETAVVAAPAKSTAWDVAEDLFNKKEWKNAILKYQSYRDQFPSGPNYAMATYKIGVCFQELKMKDEAKVFYEEVIQKFAKSPTAKKAKFRLNQLK